jgi:pimeloyl-ACP methyl ester carboxylesterase
VNVAWERRGEGPPLLLIHGLGYARWGWEPVVDGLARSFDVLLFDNRGIGESDDRLVLASTHPGGTKAHPMPHRTVELMNSGASLRDFVENALEPDPRAELVDRILEHRERTAQPLDAWLAQAAAGATFDAGDRVGELEAPTLVQTGDGDVVVDPRNSELLTELLPDARLSVYEGCGHLFFWQQPERFVGELEEFLH